MLEGKALDQFMDRFWGETRNEQLLKSGKSVVEQSSLADTSEDDLEEYELKEDGIIIQYLDRTGHVSGICATGAFYPGT